MSQDIFVRLLCKGQVSSRRRR